MMLDNRTKLIFGVWEKDAVGIIPEIHCIAENKNTSMKTKIFIDKNMWDKKSYITNRNNLNIIHIVFNGVYPFDLNKIADISNTAKQILNGYSKWAVNHEGEWPGDN